MKKPLKLPAHHRPLRKWDQFSEVFNNPRDLLHLAWLTEQAACWREHVGDHRWARQLFEDAAALRDAAVNQ